MEACQGWGGGAHGTHQDAGCAEWAAEVHVPARLTGRFLVVFCSKQRSIPNRRGLAVGSEWPSLSSKSCQFKAPLRLFFVQADYRMAPVLLYSLAPSGPPPPEVRGVENRG